MGYTGNSTNQQIQITLPGLDHGLDFRVTDSDNISSFYIEPPIAVLQDHMKELHSPLVLVEGMCVYVCVCV